ncbi:MAG: type IV pilin N-terminal domain-containing protein [Candidatus Methanomethylophilaceae archaeon]|nr:type IV pilin N-terminal domain-containing protein [Candidatus Methanomethylophilaceae archaeon]
MIKGHPRSRRDAVSPVIATILMVAVTVVISAVLMVMVMGFMNPVEAVPMGYFSQVEDRGEDGYYLTLGPVTSSFLLSQARLEVNGISSTQALDNHSSFSTRYQALDGSIQFYAIGGAGGRFGTGDQLVLLLGDSMEGSRVDVRLIHLPTGFTIARTTFLAMGSYGTSIDLSSAVSKNGAVTAFPLSIVSSQQQSLSLPQSSIGPLGQNFTVTAKVTLRLAPDQQEGWASIFNSNGDNGFRLQLSGSSDGNRHFEFGTRAGWVRSDGTGIAGFSGIQIVAGTQYTVMGVYSMSDRTVQIFVNNSQGTMVLMGQKSVTDAVPTLGTSGWHIGGTGYNAAATGRFFDGTIHSLNVIIS